MVAFQKGTQKFHETNLQLDEIYITPWSVREISWGRFRWKWRMVSFIKNTWQPNKKTYYAKILTHLFLLKWTYWNNMVWRQTFVTFVQYIIPYYSNIITRLLLGKHIAFTNFKDRLEKVAIQTYFWPQRNPSNQIPENFHDSVVSVGISKKHPFKINTTPKLPLPPPLPIWFL